MGDEQRVEPLTPEQRARLRELDDLRAVMGTEQGRRLVWRLLGWAGVYRSSFDSDALVMSNREGRREVGLFLTAEIDEACPHRFVEMLQESNKEESSSADVRIKS